MKNPFSLSIAKWNVNCHFLMLLSGSLVLINKCRKYYIIKYINLLVEALCVIRIYKKTKCYK